MLWFDYRFESEPNIDQCPSCLLDGFYTRGLRFGKYYDRVTECCMICHLPICKACGVKLDIYMCDMCVFKESNEK